MRAGSGWVRRGIAIAAGLLAIGGGAYAAIPNASNDVIVGCYRKSDGVLRVIDAEDGDTCARNEHRLPWNQQGPRGLRGQRGPAGTAGNTIRSGFGAPTADLGSIGDFFLDRSAMRLYGPKTDGGWGAGVALRDAAPGTATQGMFTFYAQDPVGHTLCFRDNKAGQEVAGPHVANRCSDVDYDKYTDQAFTAGIEGSRAGTIVDIGTATNLYQQYGATFGFAAIRLNEAEDTVEIFGGGSYAEMEQATDVLFGDAPKSSSAPAVVGHNYLLRLTDGADANFSEVFLFVVTEHTPDEVATIRWRRLTTVD